jgi:hypothetical protein
LHWRASPTVFAGSSGPKCSGQWRISEWSKKATQTVAAVFAGTLDPAAVTGPDRHVADRVWETYRCDDRTFPVPELVARREAHLELGSALFNVVRAEVKALDQAATHCTDDASRDAFLDVGSYYLELIGVSAQTGIIRLAFLQTFYGDPQIILLYAVLRYVRQQLPDLWENLKRGTIFVLGDIGNTNKLTGDVLGFPPGSAEAAQIVAIDRILWIYNKLYDQQGSDKFGDLPKTESDVRAVPEPQLAGLLSANLLQLYAEVPALVLR